MIVGAWLIWFRNNDKPLDSSKKSDSSKVAEKLSDELPDTVVETSEPNPDPNVPGGSTGSDAGEDVGPAAPSGTFVSNHKPSLSGRSQIASACNTTEGAACTIRFTKDGVTKTLEAKKTDKNGSVTWDWTLQQVGLTVGSWKIIASATLNGQTKTASDPLALDVTP